MGVNCPNIEVCKLVIAKDFPIEEELRLHYIDTYCTSHTRHWESCTRLLVKRALNFCPDFVLPDLAMTPDEVIDKFDEENDLN